MQLKYRTKKTYSTMLNDSVMPLGRVK